VITDDVLVAANSVASLGADLSKTTEGFEVMEIFESDPDYPTVDGASTYSPLSSRTMSRSKQIGLAVGDVITSINHEDVLSFPSINYALRGKEGKSVKLGVKRVGGGGGVDYVIVSPISGEDCDNLRYSAWEYRTRKAARQIAKDNGKSVGYVHLRDMSGAKSEDSFARQFFGDYNKDGMIIDVRHNRGGNIDVSGWCWFLLLLSLLLLLCCFVVWFVVC
jgi:tricorn protease